MTETAAKCYAVRQFRSGKILGSRPMSEAEATVEVAAWRAGIGRAAVTAADEAARAAVRSEDQDALGRLLDAGEPHVWISTTSHRSRDRLRMVHRIADDNYGPGPEYGSWPHGSWPHGSYYLVNTRHLEAIGRIPGIRVLRAEPREKFKRWTGEDMGMPKRGGWPVPAS